MFVEVYSIKNLLKVARLVLVATAIELAAVLYFSIGPALTFLIGFVVGGSSCALGIYLWPIYHCEIKQNY